MQPLYNPSSTVMSGSVATTNIQPIWQDANVDNTRLPVIDPLCPELTAAGLADELEPGEVVFEGGVAQIGPTTSAKPPTTTSVSSAHNLYNSYAYNPWARFRDGAGSVVAALTGSAGGICERDGVLRAEVRHLHAALEEKTREVGELTRDLQNAYDTINKLRQIQNNVLPPPVSTPDKRRSLSDGLETEESSVVAATFAAGNMNGMIAPDGGHTLNVPVDIELNELCSELEQAGGNDNSVSTKSPISANAATTASLPV